MMIHPEVILLCKNILVFVGYVFYMILSIVLLKYEENCVVILVEIALNLYIAFGKMVIFNYDNSNDSQAWKIFLTSDVLFLFQILGFF